MKEISINQNSSTERVKFGPVGRDIILNEKIEDETARAIAKETQLEEAIAQAGAVKDVRYNGTSIVANKIAEIKPSIEASVAVETTRATAAETTLTTNLAAETTARQTADTTLQTNINNEATTRLAADTAEATARAAQDLVLNTRIDNIENRGRYLSTWNATTGKPGSYPEVPVGAEYPYTYTFKPGDYYIINNVPATGTKYKPTGSSITKQTAESEWTIGSAEETESVSNNGSYTFDSTNWILISSGTVAAWGSIGGNITDQTDLADALSNKVDLSSAQTITGVKTFSNGLKTSSNASIGSDTAGSSFKWNDVSYLNVRYDGIYPVSYYSDMSVGGFNNKWKDVYLNGAVKFPTSSTTDYLELKGESNGNVSINRKFNTVDYPVVTFSGNNATFVYGLTVVDVPLTRSSDFNSLHIGGDKNLSLNGNIYPQYSNGKSIGTSDYKWGDLYLSGTAHIGTASYITTDTWDSLRFISNSGTIWSNSDIVTDNSNGKLGTSENQWKDLYLSGTAYVADIHPSNDLYLGDSSYGVFSRGYAFMPVSSSATLGASNNQWSDLYVKNINMTGALSADGSQGTAGQVLTSNGPDAPATWQDASGGGGGEYTIINLSDLPIQSGTNRKLNFNDYPSGSYILRYDGTSTSEVVSTVYIHVNNSGSFKATVNLYGSIDSYNLAYFRIFEGQWPGTRSFDFIGYTAQSWKRYAGQASSNTSTSSGKWTAVGDSWEIGRFIKSFNGSSYGQPGNDWSSYYFDLYAPTNSGTSGQFLKSNGTNNAPTWTDAPAPSNMVTTDTPQTITGAKSFVSGNNNITVANTDGISKIKFTGTGNWGTTAFGVNGGDPNDNNRPYFELVGHFRPTTDGTKQNLGDSSHKWKDIYAAGNISDGTNSTSVANITVKSSESTITGQQKIAVVSALPENPDANTIYFIV